MFVFIDHCLFFIVIAVSFETFVKTPHWRAHDFCRMAKTKAVAKSSVASSGGLQTKKKSLKVKNSCPPEKSLKVQPGAEISEKRKLRRRDSGDMANRAITLKLGAFSKAQIAMNKNENGEVAPEVVIREVRRCRDAGCKIPMQFWIDLIRSHKLGGSLADGMPAPSGAEVVNPELDHALRIAHCVNPAKKSALPTMKFLDYNVLNETEYFGVIRGSIEGPTLSRSMATSMSQALLRYTGRTRADQEFPGLWAHMKDAFDNIILDQWLSAQSRGMTRHQFMRAKRAELQLFFDMEKATQAIATSDAMEEPNEPIIDELASSSYIGYDLFKPETLVSELTSFKSDVARRLKELELQFFPPDENEAFRQICMRLASTLDQECFSKMDMKNHPLPYLSDTISSVVTCSNDLWFNAREARIRTLAVSGNHVRRLPHETWMYGTSAIPGCPETIQLPENLVFDMSNSRELLWSKLDLVSPLSVEAVRRTIRMNRKELRSMDACFWMDEIFITETYDALMESRCKDMALALVPDGKQVTASLEKATNAGRLLLAGEIISAQKDSLRRELKDAVNLLSELSMCRGPNAAEAARLSLWHAMFLKKCENFAFYEEEHFDGKGRAKTLKYFGPEAVTRRYTAAQNTAGVKSAEDMKAFKTFAWMLSKDQLKMVHTWEKELVSSSASRLKESKAKMIKDAEESLQQKKRPGDAPPIQAPPLKKSQAPATSSSTDLVFGTGSDKEDDDEEEIAGLCNFFGARAL